MCDPTIDIYLYTLFRSSYKTYNTLTSLYALVLATPHAFILRSLAIVSHGVHFLDNNYT